MVYKILPSKYDCVKYRINFLTIQISNVAPVFCCVRKKR